MIWQIRQVYLHVTMVGALEKTMIGRGAGLGIIISMNQINIVMVAMVMNYAESLVIIQMQILSVLAFYLSRCPDKGSAGCTQDKESLHIKRRRQKCFGFR